MRRLLTIELVVALALGMAAPAEAQFRRNSQGQLLFNPLFCLTDYQVRQRIAAAGYSSIKLNAPIESQIQVKAVRAGHTWLIDFNRCLNRISSVTRLR